MLRLVVGLGNPGAEYAMTRHNVGFMAIDRLRARYAPGEPVRQQFRAMTQEIRIDGSRVLLMMPLTYMNLSGGSVLEAMQFYKLPPSDLLVLVDDVSLPLGAMRLRPSGSDGGHNGLADIARRLGTEEYARLRIGVGSPGLARRRDYVLGRFGKDELETLEPSLNEVCDAVAVWVREGCNAAMNRFNRKGVGREDDDAAGESGGTALRALRRILAERVWRRPAAC